MRKVLLLFMVLMMAAGTAFAGVTRNYDEFKNIYKVSSVSEIPIHDTGAKLRVSFSKIYNMGNMLYYDKKTKTWNGNLSLNFMVIDTKDYWFFNNEFDYVIDGDVKGRSSALVTGSSDPGAIVGTWGTASPSKFFEDAIKNKKGIKIRVNFRDKASFAIYTTTETLEEWNEIIKFDLNEEVKKVEAQEKK